MEVLCDTLVLGAGASGIMAAITAARNNKKVYILEHMQEACQKLLITGNGRCNLTNLYMDKSCYGMDCSDFAMNIINKFSEKDTIRFFNELGMLTHSKNGYVYPYTNQAATVRQVLLTEVVRLGINLKTGISVKKIKKDSLKRFILITDRDKYICHNLIMATGSKAYEKTGSDGSGYELAKGLGHKIIKPLPSLTALVCRDDKLKNAQGVRTGCKITLWVDDKEIIDSTGEVQITAYGISGIPVFQVSRYAVKAVDEKKKVFCTLDFLPEYTYNDIRAIIDNQARSGVSFIKDTVQGMLNNKLLNVIAVKSGLVMEKKLANTDINEVYKMIDYIKNYKIDIIDYKSFDFGQVCQGGVDLREVCEDTLESKIIKGLYFAGEILNVDGACGGYNLQWAFSSGYVAGGAFI